MPSRARPFLRTVTGLASSRWRTHTRPSTQGCVASQSQSTMPSPTSRPPTPMSPGGEIGICADVSEQFAYKALAETHQVEIALPHWIKIRSALSVADWRGPQRILQDLLECQKTSRFPGLHSDENAVRPHLGQWSCSSQSGIRDLSARARHRPPTAHETRLSFWLHKPIQ